MSETRAESVPKVYAWCNSGMGTDCQIWMAMAEDGTVLAQHCSSSREFGIADVTPRHFPHRIEAYDAHFGGHEEGADYELIVCPEGEGPPDEVATRNQQQRIEHEAVPTDERRAV